MGKIDSITKKYVRKNHIFADIFNQYIFDGKQVIQPDQLRERDITEITGSYNMDGNIPVQKYRDILKILQIMEDDKAVYVLLGTELESKINYAMPPKNMLYDAINYDTQVKNIAKKYALEKGTKLSDDEFLSGFTKDDKLMPVITLVIYFGNKKWDAPKSLHEMFGEECQEYVRLIPDYRINLISPEAMSPDDIEKFHTEFRQVMKFIKYSRDKNELRTMLEQDKSFEAVDKDTADVINIVTNLKIKTTEKEGPIDMCKAVKDLIEEGHEKGLEEGHEKGLEEGIEKGALMSMVKLLKQGLISISQAADAAGMTTEEFEKKAAALA